MHEMKYTKVSSLKGDILVAHQPAGFGLPYEKLFEQTELGGCDVFASESKDGFDNDYSRASQELYDKGWDTADGRHLKGFWGENFRDTVENGRYGEVGGRLHVLYKSRAGTDKEIPQHVWMPKSGLVIPDHGLFFIPGSLCPIITTENLEKAKREWKKQGLNPKYLFGFYRPENYNNGYRIVGRLFDPYGEGGGRFGVDAGGLPGDSGDGAVGARLKHMVPASAMEVKTEI